MYALLVESQIAEVERECAKHEPYQSAFRAGAYLGVMRALASDADHSLSTVAYAERIAVGLNAEAAAELLDAIAAGLAAYYADSAPPELDDAAEQIHAACEAVSALDDAERDQREAA